MKTKAFGTAPLRSGNSIPKLTAGVVFLALALSASARDADGPVASSPQQPVARAKTVAHKTRHWYQIGIASWYGTYFQGRTTANGEQFDMNSMTCAHPTLPMGTWLRVTNLRNRHSAFVRVNDRGPVTEGRIVDLSAAAARVLGLAGIGRVRIEAVRESDPELTMALIAGLRTPSLLQPISQ
jgi:rare lipoprotein A